jgi:ESF2/ABP1 family protein
MATRKRNEFLDIDGSEGEESDRGYDSEAAEESKGRAAKRRKVLDADSDFSDSEDERHDDHGGGVAIDEDLEDEGSGDFDRDLQDEDDVNSVSWLFKPESKQKLIKPLDKPSKKNKTGVVYLSSLPPYLKPFALKTLLVQRGFEPITKIFLSPSVHSTRSSGKRGNRRKTYTDGWVEFASKKTAKICAETLNANIVGGRKGGWYHDDVWNMKYLKGFKWADLMEQVQRERSEREARRRIEDARSRKEDKVFVSGVEKGKVEDGIRKKREEKKAKAADDVADNMPDLQVRRVFKQNEVCDKGGDKDFSSLGEDTKRVLGKIF